MIEVMLIVSFVAYAHSCQSPLKKAIQSPAKRAIFSPLIWAIDYMTVLITASLFHGPLDSQAPPPCTLKSAPLAKIMTFGNTGAHECSRENTQLSSGFRGISSPPISQPHFLLALYAGPIQEYARSFFGWKNHLASFQQNRQPVLANWAANLSELSTGRN